MPAPWRLLLLAAAGRAWRPSEDVTAADRRGSLLQSREARNNTGGHFRVSDTVPGTKFRSACDRLVETQKTEACDVDEFIDRAWVTSWEMECQLNKAQSLVHLVSQRYAQVAKDTFQQWQAEHARLWPEERLAKATTPAAAMRTCGPADREGGVSWCQLTDCPESCARCRGQLYFRTVSGRRLIMLPQPFHEGWADAYSYDSPDGSHREFRSIGEAQHFNLSKIDRALWFATVADNMESAMEKEEIFFTKGVQTHLRYMGNDPAIVIELFNRNATASDMCIGAPNWNVVDKGNHDRYFRERDAAAAAVDETWPFWKAPPGRSIAVASQVVFDHENTSMGVVRVDINMSTLSRRMLEARLARGCYSAIVNREGSIMAMSHSAKEVMFAPGLSTKDILGNRTQRCHSKMTAEQLRNCTWSGDEPKALLLSDALDPAFSGANFSGILEDMFEAGSNCMIGMKQDKVFFPKAEDSADRWHTVVFCSFSSVPNWGLMVGANREHLEQVGHMSVLPLPDPTVRTWPRKYSLTASLNMSLRLRDQGKALARNVTFILHNDGVVPLPWMVEMPAHANSSRTDGHETSFAMELLEGRYGYLLPGEKVKLHFRLTFNGTTWGRHKETVIVKANIEEPRGVCFRHQHLLHIKVDLEGEEAWVRRVLRQHGQKILASLVVMCLAACAVPVALHLLAEFRSKVRREAEQNRKVEEALESVDCVAFPMVLMSAKSFKSLGTLVSHEELQRRHEDVWLHTVEDVRAFSREKKIVFISHQWTAFGAPDPTNTQYEAMLMSIETLSLQEEWREEEVYVWVDYSSIPQKHRGTQKLAINSLTIYASNVAAFVVVAPEVRHAELGDVCDKASYQRRAWCRAEQLSHLLALGSSRMYLAESGVLTPLSQISGWLEQSSYVFQGDLTCCRRMHEGMERCDKELLVVPMLGLWAQLCRRCQEEPREDLLAIQRNISRQIDEVFPRAFHFRTKDATEERPLFGDLTDRLRARHLPDAAVTGPPSEPL